jgi:N-acetylmuramoyl-L-alanine amidase
MAAIQVRNRLRRAESVTGATVQLAAPAMPTPVTANTNQAGVANLVTTGLADGGYTLTVTPAATTADPVGPAIGTAASPDRIFRSLRMDVTLVSGAISAATVPAGDRLNGTVVVTPNQPLAVSLQPVWMRSPNSRTRGHDVTGIIVHHTGGATIGGALEEFLNNQTSAHYLIDTDGQIVKMVLDSRAASHAGVARWNGDSNVNSRTVGIEIVNSTGPYPVAQYTALTGLLTRLRAALPTLVPWNVVGHSDVATNDSGRLGRKSGDPGLEFEWARVEALGLGMSASTTPIVPTVYAGFFVSFPTDTLRSGDNDARRQFGGSRRPTLVGNPVRELQTDLQIIGYEVGRPDGDFGQKTQFAVQMFQEHFFAGGRGHKAPDGRVDRQTATTIKAAVVAKAAALVTGITGAAAGVPAGNP